MSPKSGSAGTLVPPTAPKEPKDADDAKAGSEVVPKGNQTSSSTSSSNTPPTDPPQHKPEENKDKKSWIEIQLVYESNGKPVAGVAYEVTLPDGETIAGGSTDENGVGRVEHIDPGSCQISFPNLDKEAWEDA
jgi:hypothetical protein